MNSNNDLNELRAEIEDVNEKLLALLNQRAALVTRVQQLKTELGLPTFCPERENAMYEKLLAHNNGPFSNQTVKALFREIFKASLDLMYREKEATLLVCRKETAPVIKAPRLIAGPCAVEDEAQMRKLCAFMAEKGVTYIRGGVFKPRSSPYSFQGLGLPGLQLFRRLADEYQLKIVSEIMNPRQIAVAAPYIDVIQVGARNMYNYDLLKELGQLDKPILLKRGLAATIEEFIYAAEYIAQEGNRQIILCERGIRTFEKATRNTLDISAVPILKQQTNLPVLVDISHAAGRRDLLLPLGKAALAAGADGLMVEVHPDPPRALSDSEQQIDLNEFACWQQAVFGEKQ